MSEKAVKKPEPNHDGWNVKAAFLQTAVILPGAMTESSLTKEKIPGIEMMLTDQGCLLVKIKGHEAMIPAANIKIVHLA